MTLERAAKRSSTRATERFSPSAVTAFVRLALPLAGAALVAAALLHGLPARAATYKWVDEQGVIHYTDKMPPEAVNKGNVELNKQGVPIKKTDPALTAEQRRQQELQAEQQRQIARQAEEVARRDRALLSSFTSEAEIDLSRKRGLQTIESIVMSAQAYSEQLTKRKAALTAQREASGDKPVSPAVERELTSIDVELGRQSDLLAQKRREAAALEARYEADKKRWRELTATRDAPPVPPSAPAAPNGVQPAAAAAVGGATGGGAGTR
jgi:hypothetical protein